jgi:hypothetical protein
MPHQLPGWPALARKSRPGGDPPGWYARGAPSASIAIPATKNSARSPRRRRTRTPPIVATTSTAEDRGLGIAAPLQVATRLASAAKPTLTANLTLRLGAVNNASPPTLPEEQS